MSLDGCCKLFTERPPLIVQIDMMRQKPCWFRRIDGALPTLLQMLDKLRKRLAFAGKFCPLFPANGVTVRIDNQQAGGWTHLHTWTKRRYATITTRRKLGQQLRSQMIPGWHDNRQKNRAELILQWLPAHLQISQYRSMPPVQTQFPGALTRSARRMVDMGIAMLRNSYVRNARQAIHK